VGVGSALALALLNVVVTGFLVVGAQGLTLRGPPNSVAKAVGILGDFWEMIRNALIASLLCMLTTAISICWMKLEFGGAYPAAALACTAIVCGILAAGWYTIMKMYNDMAIDMSQLVRGDLNVGVGMQMPRPVDVGNEKEATIPVRGAVREAPFIGSSACRSEM